MSKKDGFDGFDPPPGTHYSIGGSKGKSQIPIYKNEFKKIQNERPEEKTPEKTPEKVENFFSAFLGMIKKIFK